jgi:hypothetical protein
MIPTKQKNAHQTMMAVAAVLRLPWGPTPGFYSYNNQQTYNDYGTGLFKTRSTIIINVYF